MASTNVGDVHSRLTVVSFSHYQASPSGTKRDKWNCVCICGKETCVDGSSLRRGKTKSCGCYSKERSSEVHRTHGMSGTPAYGSWIAVVRRCTMPECNMYSEYGGIGITVCNRWLEPDGRGFLNFLEDMGERPDGKTLNRINGAKIYSKETCEWATLSVQAYDQKINCNNKSGKSGVFLNKYGKWEVSIKVNNKGHYLGSFLVFEDAVKVREAAELKYFGFLKDRTDDRELSGKFDLDIM